MSHAMIGRRGFLGAAAVGSLGMAAGLARAEPTWQAFAGRRAGEVDAETAFARLERLAEGVWAVVSTPFDDHGGFAEMTTTCNGGIVAGTQGVFVIDGYNTPAGGAWISEQCVALTGMRPTHVAVTHYHADHSGGLAGFQYGAEGPEIFATATTRRLILERNGAPSGEAGESGYVATRGRLLAPDRVVADDAAPFEIDLGGRHVRLETHRGHTASDLVAVVSDPAIVFDGDLVWDGVFPNFVDAEPVAWRAAVRELLADPARLHVTGHGNVLAAGALGHFAGLLDEVELAARKAHGTGTPAEDAAAAFRMPDSLGPWPLFNPRQYLLAFNAWYRELG